MRPAHVHWDEEPSRAVISRLPNLSTRVALLCLALGACMVRVYLSDGSAYVGFIADSLKPRIDRQYRTLSDRAHTGIGGARRESLGEPAPGGTAVALPVKAV